MMDNPDAVYIRTLFDKLARRYDLFNHLTSMGLAGIWRAYTLKRIEPGMSVLDLGCGTGDLCVGVAKKLGPTGRVVGLDFSKEMLLFAQKRMEKIAPDVRPLFTLIHGKAEALPINGEIFDCVVSGFVLRNLYENIDKILKGVFRSLKDGGSIHFLDFTKANSPMINLLWKLYMRTFVAFYGKILFGKDYPTVYMTQSAERFLKTGPFTEKLKQAGFEGVRTTSFLLGIIKLYEARKPLKGKDAE